MNEFRRAMLTRKLPCMADFQHRIRTHCNQVSMTLPVTTKNKKKAKASTVQDCVVTNSSHATG